MFEKFLALVERIADALEVIAAAKTGNDAPRVAPTETKADTEKAVDDKAAKAKAAEAKAAKEAKAKALAEKEAKAAAAEKAAKAAEDEADPLGDPPTEAKAEYTDKEVKDLLARVIDQDGRAAAFAILKDKGGGAKSFTELKKEHYEDVYVACKDKLGE